MTRKREQPVYEKLAPNECLIVSRDAEGFTVACNKDGEVTFKHVTYYKEPREGKTQSGLRTV